MHPDTLIPLIQAAVSLVLVLSAPVVIAAAAIGLMVGFALAVTSIQDQTLGIAIKLLGIGVLLAMLGSWMGHEMQSYGERVFEQIATLGHG